MFDQRLKDLNTPMIINGARDFTSSLRPPIRRFNTYRRDVERFYDLSAMYPSAGQRSERAIDVSPDGSRCLRASQA